MNDRDHPNLVVTENDLSRGQPLRHRIVLRDHEAHEVPNGPSRHRTQGRIDALALIPIHNREATRPSSPRLNARRVHSANAENAPELLGIVSPPRWTTSSRRGRATASSYGNNRAISRRNFTGASVAHHFHQ